MSQSPNTGNGGKERIVESALAVAVTSLTGVGGNVLSADVLDRRRAGSFRGAAKYATEHGDDDLAGQIEAFLATRGL
jgi:hypothetical protein